MINPCSGVKTISISWQERLQPHGLSPKSCHHRNYIANYHCRQQSHPVRYARRVRPQLVEALDTEPLPIIRGFQASKLNLASRGIHNCPLNHILDAPELLRLCGSQAFCPAPLPSGVKVALSGNSHVFAIGNEQCYEVRPLPAPSLSSFAPSVVR